MAAKKPLRLTDLMKQVMIDISKGHGGYYGCNGRSEYGGRNGTLAGLKQRGLIDHREELTEAGQAWIAKDLESKLRPEADWSQAPEGTTHVMRSPGSAKVAWIKIDGREAFWRWPGARNWRPSPSDSSTVLSYQHVEPRPISL
jgi:hypothetical protein